MINNVLKLSPLLFIFLLLSIDLTRPPEFVEVMLLFTPFLFLLTTYLFGDKSNRRRVKNKPVTLILLLSLQLFLFFVSTFFSTNIIQSSYSLMRWMAVITTLIILSEQADLFTTKVLSVCVQFLGTVYSLIFLATLVFKINPPDYLNTVRLAGEHHQLASLLVVSIPLILSNLLSKKTGKGIIRFSKIALVINLVALVFTFARGAWLTLALIPLLLLVIKKRSVSFLGKYRWAIVLSCFLVVLVVVLGLINDFKQPDEIQRTARSFTNLHQQSLNFKTRLGYYSQALVRFKQSPVWGTGLNTYTSGLGEISPPGGVTNYTHNFLLQILTETGIFSAIIFSTILIYVVYRLFEVAKKSPNSVNIGVFLAFTLSLFYSFYDFNLNTSLVFLVIFCLAVSVIGSPDDKRGWRGGFLLLSFSTLGLFIAAGLLSTVFYVKAGQLKVGANHKMASEFYLKSLEIFPFNNNYFKETIDYLDDHLPEKNEVVIKKWLRLNHNNGEMYDFLANRSLDNGDANTALKYINTVLRLEYEPVVSSKTIQKMLKAVDEPEQAVINPELVKFVGLFDSFSLGQPNIYFSWPVVSSYYNMVVDLGSNPNLRAFSLQEQRLVLSSALKGCFILDTNVIDNSGQVIGLLDRLMVLDLGNKQYVLYKRVLAGLVSFGSLPEIDRLITELEPRRQESSTPSNINYLLSQLYMAKSRHYQLINRQGEELKYVDKAIKVSPLTGSLRIYKINRLRDLGLIEESDQALEECMIEINPLCRRWYLDYLNKLE